MKTNFFLAALLISVFSFGQLGVSSGSYSMFQSNGLNSYNERGMLNERMIIVEDFVNYHKHQIKIPTDSKPAMSIDYNNSLLNDSDKFILQIGIATPFKENLPKSQMDVNVSLVIDNSGSMSGGKLEYVKQAMKSFIGELDDGTNVSIVVFSSNAELRQKNVKLTTDRSRIYQTIDGIYTAGSTNLHAGMMLGYEEIIKAHRPGINSRLILLTDGMTNTGETNHEIILENSKKYNDQGIEISTIGVGRSIDFDLLRSLSEYGRGSNHFIGESENDIQKVFISEVESLLYNLGKDAEITIELPDGFVIDKVYGFKPEFLAENKVAVPLENLNSGQTQVILMKILKNANNNPRISAILNYTKDGKPTKETEIIRYSSTQSKNTNREIPKNYSIALMADALKQFAGEFANGTQPTKTKIENAMKFAERKSDTKDEDVKRIYELLKTL
ncbi:MAG: VWA domain-containing protein [Weeksellaceae bacterium]